MNKVQNLGNIIKQQRKRLGLTLVQLAGISGVSQSYLGRVENAQRYPSVKVIRKIAKPLRFDERELFNLAGYLPGEQSMETDLDKHKSLAELDILINRVIADLNRIKNIIKKLYKSF
jgi:transcriptional regulator with XRE-family HTH domain